MSHSFSSGKARHLGFDSRLDARAVVFQNRQLIELLRYFLPEESALCGEFNGAFGDAAQVGDVPLRRLAINSMALGQDSRPVGIGAGVSTKSPRPTRALLPPDKDCHLVKKNRGSNFIHYATKGNWRIGSSGSRFTWPNRTDPCTRLKAGCCRFLTLTQRSDRPPR